MRYDTELTVAGCSQVCGLPPAVPIGFPTGAAGESSRASISRPCCLLCRTCLQEESCEQHERSKPWQVPATPESLTVPATKQNQSCPHPDGPRAVANARDAACGRRSALGLVSISDGTSAAWVTCGAPLDSEVFVPLNRRHFSFGSMTVIVLVAPSDLFSHCTKEGVGNDAFHFLGSIAITRSPEKERSTVSRRRVARQITTQLTSQL